MAAGTVASTSRDHVIGDQKERYVAFTALADTNTYDVGVGQIMAVYPVKVSTSASVTATWSGTVITFTVSAGTPDATIAIRLG